MTSVTHEHILVCLSSAPSNGNIIPTAAKMRDAYGGSLTALYVQTEQSRRMRPEDAQRLQRHIRLAEELGASISTVSGDDVAYQIAEFARLSKVTKIVIGRSSASFRRFSQKSLTDKLIELAPHLDLYIIPDMAGENPKRRAPVHRPGIKPTLGGILITLAGLVLSTAVGFLSEGFGFTEANIITIYILGVLLTALFTRNAICSILSSLLGVLLFNFFFAEPLLDFRAYETGYPMTFAIALIAALITSAMAKQLDDNAKHSAQAAWRTQILLDTNQQLQQAGSEQEILQVTAAQLIKLLSRPLVVWPAGDHALSQPIYFSAGQAQSPFSGEPEVAAWVFARQKRAGASTETFPEAQGLYFSLHSNGEAFGVVGFPMGQRPLEPFENSILLSILGEGALAMENHRNARQKEAAAVLAKNEQLRADLLRSISHDLRTPLTSISGNAENLLRNLQTMDDATQKSTLTDIYDDAIWLGRLVENLLAITRIGDGHTRLNLSTELVEDVISESLRHIRRRSSRHTIETQLPDELLLAQMDARLVSQVIINLVDNAIKYTPEGTVISISAQRQGEKVAIRIADTGPGIPDSQKARIFDMFYTGETKVADCRRSMGLGLALCKSIVTIHGGEITLADNHPSGCVFIFTLPASEVNIHE